MATSKIVQVPCAFVLAIALFFSSQLTAYASDDPVASDTPVEAANQASTEAASDASEDWCREGYECTPLDPVIEGEEDGPACHGVLTCTFYVGGHIIALPFRFLNWVFRIAI